MGFKKIAIAATAGIALVLAASTPALAADNPNATSGSSATSGSAVVRSGMVKPFDVANVGGGTWNYGADTGTFGLKHCYSHYVHNSHQHTATVIIHDQNVKVSRAPGTWANADANDGWAYTCYTYWNVI